MGVPVRKKNVCNQCQVLVEGTTLGSCEPVMWATLVNSSVHQTLGTHRLCEQMQEVVSSARPNLNAKEAKLELLIEFQDIFTI
jgi:hypothetical protein